MDEFSFDVEGPSRPAGYPRPTAALPAGQAVLVTLQNDGGIVHEWRVGEQVLADGGYEDDLLAMMEPQVLSGTGYRLVKHEEDAEAPGGLTVEVEPGASVTLRLHVPADAAGTWEMGCFITGHYEAGMRAELRIE
ncbi:MAG TPA: hypothetical protein VF058_08770 [Actinomycetota bacterium]